MKNKDPRKPIRLFLASALLVLWLVSFQGCKNGWGLPSGDQAKLQNVLDRIEAAQRNSLREIETAQLDSLPSPALPGSDANENESDWHVDAQKLADFVNKYKDKPAIADPLRIRLAKLYMQNDEFHLAEATLESVTPHGQRSPRDHTFWALRDSMLWWWKECGRGDFAPGRNVHEQGPKAIREITNQVRELEKQPGNYRIREHYAEMAVHIANYLVPLTLGVDGRWEYVQEPVLGAYALFADTVGPEAIQAAAASAPGKKVQLRRVVRIQMIADEIGKSFYDLDEGQGYIHLCTLGQRHAAFEHLIADQHQLFASRVSRN